VPQRLTSFQPPGTAEEAEGNNGSRRAGEPNLLIGPHQPSNHLAQRKPVHEA
jgi:hypothetical protein